MSLILLLNPKQYGGAVVVTDTSDILDGYRKRRNKREEDLYEEQLAAKILSERQAKVELPKNLDKARFATTLRSKLDDTQVTDKKRKQIRMILLLLAMDDYE